MHNFWEFLSDSSNEAEILALLPKLTPIQQIELDIKLNHGTQEKFPNHTNLIKDDNNWKKVLIKVLNNEEDNPEVIHQLEQMIRRDLATHRFSPQNSYYGSKEWHTAWMKIYQTWLELIHEKKPQ